MRSTSIRGGLFIDWGLLGGLFAKVTFLLADGGVYRSCKVVKLDKLGLNEEVDTPIEELPLKAFVTLSLSCSNATVKSTSIEVGISSFFLFLDFYLVYVAWPTIHISKSFFSLFFLRQFASKLMCCMLLSSE